MYVLNFREPVNLNNQKWLGLNYKIKNVFIIPCQLQLALDKNGSQIDKGD